MALLVNGKKVAGIGPPGKSAYQAAVDGGYTGTESEFNTLLANATTKPKSYLITLPASAWSDNQQTVMVEGILADETKQLIQPMPATASQSAYIEAGIICAAQSAGSLTFTCTTVPTENITIYVVIQDVDYTPPPPKIYGVEWDWTSSGPTKGVRTDDAAGFGDPNPAVSNGTGSSPFDNLYPWSEMVKEERTGGTMVKEPKFWYKWTRTPSGSGVKLKLQIADGPVEGFHVDPVNMDRGDGLGELDFSYIGRYHCASGTYKSETNKAQQVDITRSEARSSIHNLGANIWQMDFAQMWYVGMLFLVEFADWNGQTAIGYGCSQSGSKQNNGRTDSMEYHTGTTAANRTTYGFTQYRNIEGWWDSVYDWMDGCYHNRNGLNVIKNPAQFSDSANGVPVGKQPVGIGYPSDLAIPTQDGMEWALYPSANNGSQTTYVPDDWYNGGSSRNLCLYHGGYYSQSQDHGPFFVCYVMTSHQNSYTGCRLQERPPKE